MNGKQHDRHLYRYHRTPQIVPNCHIAGKKTRRDVKPHSRGPGNSWSRTMGSHSTNILTAWTFATIPLAILAVTFYVVVENSKQELHPGSFYHPDSKYYMDANLDSAFLSKIPSTQLTFIASFSSTSATAVLPAVMALLSYTIARSISQDSDTEDQQRLPSPYQLELLISTLNGSLLTIWSFARYCLCHKRRRVAVIGSLWKAMSLFGTITMLAYDSSNV